MLLLLTGNARISLSGFGLVTCGSRADLGLWVFMTLIDFDALSLRIS